MPTCENDENKENSKGTQQEKTKKIRKHPITLFFDFEDNVKSREGEFVFPAGQPVSLEDEYEVIYLYHFFIMNTEDSELTCKAFWETKKEGEKYKNLTLDILYGEFKELTLQELKELQESLTKSSPQEIPLLSSDEDEKEEIKFIEDEEYELESLRTLYSLSKRR